MSTALQKITTRAKQLQKAKPNTKWITHVKAASAEYRAGSLGKVTKPKAKAKVAGVKKVSVKRVAGTPVKKKTIAAVKPAARRRVGAIGGVSKGEAVLKEIAKLETKYKGAKGDAKEFYRLAINAQHKKLNALKRSL